MSASTLRSLPSRSTRSEREDGQRVRLDAQLDHVAGHPATADGTERRHRADAVDLDADLRATPAGGDARDRALGNAGPPDDERALGERDRRVVPEPGAECLAQR